MKLWKVKFLAVFLSLLFVSVLKAQQVIYVPSGSWAIGTLITGISVALPEVVVDPGPVVVRIDRGFFTPPDGFVDMSGCFAKGVAFWADHLSKVIVRIDSVSCNIGSRIWEVETYGWLYAVTGEFGFRARIQPIEKEIWGIRIKTGVAHVDPFIPVMISLREGFSFVLPSVPGFKWKTPLSFPPDFKNFPP